MRLEELEPKWWAAPGRHGQGVVFRCPCCRKDWLCVAFANPVDGGPAWDIGTRERRPIRQLWELLYGGPYWLALKHDLVQPRGQKLSVTWSADQVEEWLALLRLPPFETKYPVLPAGATCPSCAGAAQHGSAATHTETTFPGGWKSKCTRCGAMWLTLEQPRPGR